MESGIIYRPYRPVEICKAVDTHFLEFIKEYESWFKRLEMSPRDHEEMVRGMFTMTICYSQYEFYNNVDMIINLYTIYADRFPGAFMRIALDLFHNPEVLYNYHITQKVIGPIIEDDELNFVKLLKSHGLDHRKYLNYFKGDQDALQSLFN